MRASVPSRKLTKPALAGFPPAVTVAVNVILCRTLAATGSADNVMALLADAHLTASNGKQISKPTKPTGRINL
jgi:hypothetical protein